MARDLVQKAGGYPPFGGTIDDQGQVGLVFDQNAVSGGPPSPDATNKVLNSVRTEAKASNIRAAAVAGMAFVNDPETNRQTTSMVITLHHRTGRNVDFVTPFSKAASGEIRFGKPFAGLSKTTLF
jgi:hypothetical protein